MDENQTETTKVSDQVSKEDLIGNIQKFHLLTFVGLGLILVFIIFCFITYLAIQWWLMVPIAIGSAVLLFKRKKEASGLEKQVCTYGIWTIIGVFILRDIVMAHQFVSLIDGLSGAARELQNMFE